MPQLSPLATVTPPAAGAPATQILIGTLIAGSMTGGVLLLAWLHRTGRTTLLDQAGRLIGRIQGLPTWAAIPTFIGYGSLGLAFLGVYWDISLHVDKGRDPGPLANAAHYPILFGLQGLFLAGVLALVLPPKNSYVGPSAVRVGPSWRTPTAAIALMSCAAVGYLGFPLDDVWHRLFGQDVTLWGPTHLMMIFGAVLSILALAMMQIEGERAYGPPRSDGQRLRRRALRVQNPAAMLIAGSLLAGEWDWGIQQYLMIWRPLILAAVAGLALVYARRWGGRGAALAAAAFYAVARLVVNLIVGEGLGQTMPAMPLFFVEALVVEGVAMIAVLRASTLRFGIASGIGIGTIGFAWQYLWSQFAMPTPWEPQLIWPALPAAVLAASAAGVLGGLLAQSLRGQLALEPNRRMLGYGSTAVLVALACLAGNQDYSSGPMVTTTLSDVRQVSPATGTGPLDGAIRHATITATFDDPKVAEDAMSIMTIAWQGGGVVSDAMERIAPGVYRTTEPIPLGGSWKTITRMQLGRRMLAVPVELPADPAIPVGSHRNPGTERQQMQNELMQLQRERRPDVPTWLWAPAIIFVLGGIALFAIGLGIAVARIGLRVTPDDEAGASLSAEPERSASRPGGAPSARRPQTST